MISPDPRIEWLCENVPAFKPAYIAAEKARKETEDNRQRMAELMSKPAVANAGVPK